MITVPGSKEVLSSLLQNIVTKEDPSSHSGRIAEARAYHVRRYEMASSVIEEERSPETLKFAADTQIALKNFDPSLIEPKRWIGIGKLQIPYPFRWPESA